jgi:PAS domain S-box-containing protein
MNWAVTGVVYAVAYAALVSALSGREWARLVAGNIGLLLPPLALLAALLRRRGAWRGRQAVFFAALGAWAALWFVGQIGWAYDELLASTPLPWFKWHIVLQLCGSALPLIALVAWPHRDGAAETAITVVLDIAVLFFLTGFLYWSLITAPGMVPAQSPLALRTLAIIGPLVRLSAVIGLAFAARSAAKGPWAAVYWRLALGLGIAFVLLVVLGFATVDGSYATGAILDIGWMLPFFFAASAVAIAPASPARQRIAGPWSTRHSSPALLFAALLTVTVVGYSSRYLMPLGPPVDDLRELATAFTLICGGAIVMVRLRVEQRAVEQANQRVRLLATACEQAGELIIIAGPDGHIEYANDAFCRASGYTHEELDSLPPNLLVAPESCGEIASVVERLRARETFRISVALARKDGSTFNAACAAAPIVDDAGRVTHFVGVIRDVTEELRLREQLVRGERLSAVGEFVSGVAHEINNPLQSVIGTLELLLGHPHDADVRVDLERTRFEAGRAGRIVRNLLTFVRHSSKERLLMDLNEIVKSTMGVRAFELEMSGITTREDYAPVLPLVQANREEIQQVVLHLVINAQQAMAGVEGLRVLSVRTFLIGGDAVLDVSDTGPGIPPGVAGRIFEPFFTTKTTGGGAGLGLSLSLGIANAHRGTLDLVPTETGCCFRLTLPGAGFPGPASVH